MANRWMCAPMCSPSARSSTKCSPGSALSRADRSCRSWRPCCTTSLRRCWRCVPASRRASTRSSPAVSRRIPANGTHRRAAARRSRGGPRLTVVAGTGSSGTRHAARSLSRSSSLPCLAAGTATWVSVRSSRVRWARQVGLPEIESLVARDQSDAGRPSSRAGAGHHPGRSAARAADQRRDGPDHASRRCLQGVDVATKSYLNPAGEWLPLGTTPLRERARTLRVPALAPDEGRLRTARSRRAGGSVS